VKNLTIPENKNPLNLSSPLMGEDKGGGDNFFFSFIVENKFLK
jgi:hypothetical protein